MTYYNPINPGPNAAAPYQQPGTANPANNPAVGIVPVQHANNLSNPPSAPGPGSYGAKGTLVNPATGLIWQTNPDTGAPFAQGIRYPFTGGW